LVAVDNGDHGGFVRDVPLLPVPSPSVNPGALSWNCLQFSLGITLVIPLRRIVTNGLGEACLELQIAGSLCRDSES
jgi:hypothetical protein